MTAKVLFYIVLSVFLSSLAQISLKFGIMKFKVVSIHAETLAHKVWLIVSNLYILTGISLYGLGMVVWLVVLMNIDVSRAYPFVGLGFIFTMGLAYFVLGENITLTQVIGISQIILGIILISRS